MTAFDTRAVERSLAQWFDKVKPDLADALLETLEDVQLDSDHDAPRLTGAVVRSSAVKVDTGALVGGVGYSHPSAPAAHENLSVRYKRGKKAKFLESAVEANKDELPKRVAAAVERHL